MRAIFNSIATMAQIFTHAFRPRETVQYPEKRLEPKDRFRGMFGYSLERCIDCHLCAKACPIDIIHIRDHQPAFTVVGRQLQGRCNQVCPANPTGDRLLGKRPATTKCLSGISRAMEKAAASETLPAGPLSSPSSRARASVM